VSSDTSIAKVNDKGVVTPVNFAGYQNQTITITAYVNANPTLIETITLTISKVFPTSLQIQIPGVVEAGKTITITPTFGPVDVTDRQLSYSSSNPSVATVSSYGDVGIALGQSVGRVTITATSLMDPLLTATLELEVVEATILTPDVISGIYLFVRKGIGHMGLNFINGLIGFFTFYAFFSDKKSLYFYLSVTMGVALGFIFEGLQFFAPGRTPDFLDVIYNVVGYLLAQVILLSIFITFKKRQIKIVD
jgi:VanZ family protein